MLADLKGYAIVCHALDYVPKVIREEEREFFLCWDSTLIVKVFDVHTMLSHLKCEGSP